jgi:hypothetical protein
LARAGLRKLNFGPWRDQQTNPKEGRFVMNTFSDLLRSCQLLSAADQEIINRGLDFAASVFTALYLGSRPLLTCPLEAGLYPVYIDDSSASSSHPIVGGDRDDHPLTDELYYRTGKAQEAFDAAVKRHKRKASPSTLILVDEIRAAYRIEQGRLRQRANADSKAYWLAIEERRAQYERRALDERRNNKAA